MGAGRITYFTGWCATTPAARAFPPLLTGKRIGLSRCGRPHSRVSNRPEDPEDRLFSARRIAAFLLLLLAFGVSSLPAFALEAASVPLDGKTLDLTKAVQLFRQPDDRIQVSTAPGSDGIVRRIEVRARGKRGRGLQLGRVRADQRRRPADRPAACGAPLPPLWLGAVLARPSARRASRRSRRRRASRRTSRTVRTPTSSAITLDPGAVVTFVAELRTPELPQLYLWTATPTRTRLTATRSTAASCSASAACWRCS